MMMLRRALVVTAVAALTLTACAGGDGESDTTSGRAGSFSPEIMWSMPARFGLDSNDDGRIDLPNTAEYAHNLAPGSCSEGCPAAPPAFTVSLSGAGSTSDVGPIEEYGWQVRVGSELVADATSTESETEVLLPEGQYTVTLTVRAGGQTAEATSEIEVQDHLIVGMGDSYSSGEGNPEMSRRDASGSVGVWADDGSDGGSAVAEQHRRAHRSTLAATSQAALDLEAASEQSSVTHLLVASSGATIDRGLLGSHPGVPYEQVAETELPAQIDAIATMLGCVATTDGPRCNRTIDALTLSIGGNDMGFGLVWGGLIAADPTFSLGRAYEFAINEIFEAADVGIRALAAEYAALAETIESRLEVAEIYLVAYPSPVGSGDDLCDEAAGDLVRGFEADRDEILETMERVLEPLWQTMEDAASAHGWTYVDAHLDDFASHGYCRDDPYPASAYPGNPFPGAVPAADPGIRWFRRAEESTEIQGVPGSSFRPDDLATRGTLHPNEFGHQSIKDALLAVLDLG